MSQPMSPPMNDSSLTERIKSAERASEREVEAAANAVSPPQAIEPRGASFLLTLLRALAAPGV